jgi:hypothetical protein
MVGEYANELMHAGRDTTWAQIDHKYNGINKKEVTFLLDHCTTCAQTPVAKIAGRQEAIDVQGLWE